MTPSFFQPGFRLSAFDVVVLIVGVASAGYAATIHIWTGLAIGFVVGHFFLFCNVLRMSRELELIWAAIFCGLAVAAMADVIRWWIAFAVSMSTTLVLAIMEMRRPSYHGVGWKSVNPELPEWWEKRYSSR